MMKTVAYIDDNQENLDCLKLVFSSDFDLETFRDPKSFIASYPKNPYAAILVDIYMPDMDGYKVYDSLIQHPNYNGCPIIFISTDDSDLARIKSFSLGAVDFLNRRMKPEEMVARLKSKIMFFNQHRSIIEFGNLKLNLTLLKAFINNEEIKLTFIEFKLLCLALRRYPDIITKEELVDHVWGSGVVLDATIYTHVSNLNSKVSSWDHEITSIRNKGLQLTRKS